MAVEVFHMREYPVTQPATAVLAFAAWFGQRLGNLLQRRVSVDAREPAVLTDGLATDENRGDMLRLGTLDQRALWRNVVVLEGIHRALEVHQALMAIHEREQSARAMCNSAPPCSLQLQPNARKPACFLRAVSGQA